MSATTDSTNSIVIIANPTSGRGRGARTADDVAKRLQSEGTEVVVRRTDRRGDAERIAREVSTDERMRPKCVVACGGDGTVQEVAGALASLEPAMGDACPAMGLAPAGRCNDFARALGISADPAGIAEVLSHGSPTPIDLGRVNGKYFCTVATVGIDAEISDYVDRMKMPLTGTPAYIYGALCVLARYRPRPVRIEGDFGTIERPIFLASSANTSSYGGAVPIAPRAMPTDGMLDLCVIDQMSRLHALRMIPIIMSGRHVSSASVHFYRTKRLTIEAAEPLEVWADGEAVAQTPATVDVVRGALSVITASRVQRPGPQTAEDPGVASGC